ncbi:uncharacterized protein BO97DRAFT_155122, partial [Aspergillus homomorphus CBS 101889]
DLSTEALSYLLHRQHIVHHPHRCPEVIHRVTQLAQALLRQLGGDPLASAASTVKASAASRYSRDTPRRQRQGFLTADLRRQAHHHRLSHDQPFSGVQIGHHLLAMHTQPGQREPRLRQRANRNDKALRHRHPLQMPGAGGALEVRHQASENQTRIRAEDLRRIQDHLAGYGVAFLRHGGRSAAVRDEGLGDLAQLIRRHEDDIEGQLTHRPAHQRQEVDDLRYPVARHMPCDRRVLEPQLLGQAGNLQASIAGMRRTLEFPWRPSNLSSLCGAGQLYALTRTSSSKISRL